MSSFDERQKGYENKYAHDLELEFKVKSRRNKLMGIWVAEKMHMDESAAEIYAKLLVHMAVDNTNDENVVNKIQEDLRAKGVEIPVEEIWLEMRRLYALSREYYK